MIKVMSLDMDHTAGRADPWEFHQRRVAALIDRREPDIIAFQTARRPPPLQRGGHSSDLVSRLSDDYPYVLYEPAGTTVLDGSPSGLAILSRQPVSGALSFRLSQSPQARDPHMRNVLHAVYQTSSGALSVYNARFSWTPFQAESNALETLAYINSFSGMGLLAGDLNLEPGSAALEGLSSTGWTDLWARLHPGEPGFTYESNAPPKRVDYAWVNPALAPYVQDIELLGPAGGEINPSDHRALLITLTLSLREGNESLDVEI
jgi:endonuclease/exonuclease/phosphatase family metal-dependent hydrolase